MEHDRPFPAPSQTKRVDPAIRHIVEKFFTEEAVIPNTFEPEDIVFHEMFGVGQVVIVNGTGVHRKLHIKFSVAGMKIVLQEIAVQTGKLRLVTKSNS